MTSYRCVSVRNITDQDIMVILHVVNLCVRHIFSVYLRVIVFLSHVCYHTHTHTHAHTHTHTHTHTHRGTHSSGSMTKQLLMWQRGTSRSTLKKLENNQYFLYNKYS